MSISQEDFHTWLDNQLSALTLPQKAHTIQRVYEKLRLIHNAVGQVYKHTKTIAEFAAEHPLAYDKLKDEMKQFLDGDYITLEGWEYFEVNMFDPRHDAVISILLEVRVTLRSEVAENEVDAF